MAKAGLEDTVTGDPASFNCYEAFIHIVDSLFNSSEMVEVTSGLPWRVKIASL